MYKRLSMVMFPILLVALIGTGVWGYLEHQEKNAVLIKAENHYQRAFHDLSFHVDKLHTELGNTLAVNSTSQDAYKKGLINVWRITSEAQNEISQLPLTMLPFNKTEEFLANISNFAYRAAVRDLSKSPLDGNEMKMLNTLHERAAEISKELRGVQSKVIQNNLRWMDVELALATQKEPHDNVIVDGFTTVDKKVREYPEINWSPAVMSMYQKRDMHMLSGPEMSADEIKQKAAQFLGIQDPSGLQVVENGPGTEYQSFSVTAPKQGTADGAHMDYSKKGGQLLWFAASRNVPEKKLDLRQARDIGAQFLDEHGYKNMTAVSYDEYGNIAHMTYAARTNNVINYVEKIAVQVALDNGEVTGLEATDYVYGKKDRQLKAPKLTADEARKTLNADFKADSVNQALIKNDIDEEVLCYQFIGRVNGGSYRIYVNAESGAQEKIDRLGAEEAAAVTPT
ncbi:germination protein YpeB [Paenibacillus oleatilyticus]|uniref:Germination protein YpeB n=1 Tax=Paenibacillus oleatilyticus TaxID=2594886 RepID=A0ABV4UVP1_9BACL